MLKIMLACIIGLGLDMRNPKINVEIISYIATSESILV